MVENRIDELLQYFLTSNGVSTDTRSIQEGQLFFGLKGPNFDGNLYAEKALKAGASKIIIDDERFSYLENSFLVDDSLYTLQLLARAYRRYLGVPVVAVTGSNGKTTSKELLNALLSKQFKTHATTGNLNNHIGVPLTILNAPKDSELLIVEMGANHKGEIAELCLIAEPNFGLITNIGNAHLEGFGGIEGVFKGKTELFEYLKDSGGIAFINFDDKRLKSYNIDNLKYVSYSIDKEQNADYLGELEVAFPCILGKVVKNNNEFQIQSSLPGAYNFKNITAAVTIASHLKVPKDLISEGIASYMSSNNRSQVIRFKEGVVLLDAYNANPDSFEAAASWLKSRDEQKRIAVLGEMKELGEFSEKAHGNVVDHYTSIINCIVFLVGKGFQKIKENEKIQWFENAEKLKEHLTSLNWEDTVCLVKGSRSNQLELIFKTT